ncbi:YbaN family protein [Bacteroidales bacterium OttesenSCG-928-M11]|nr:YbaN family protein [Bacteroidales bacterium OttesenSCG-928-M11]
MRTLLIILGTISLVLGIIGIFLPLLPTTPFLLLTAFLYLKSSPKAYQWLISRKRLGPYIINYQEKKIIPFRTKIYAIALMWLCTFVSIVFVVDKLWLRIILLAIAIGVTIHISSFKSKE